MTSTLYLIILALLLCYLALNVVKARRKNKVSYADGGVAELQVARAAHSNATEYIPVAVLLLFALEYNGAPLWLVHIIGIVFVVGRLIHCRGILTENFKHRVLGMQLTLFPIIALSILNVFYLPFLSLGKIISF